jgi:3-deoxy-D-arabino-heptulosonate 7-phosphate (DAHP) synthase
MRNKPLLSELGRQPLPVLLYRNTASGNDEFLEAADWIRQGGNQQVILCDAGMKRFDTSTRTTLDPAMLHDLKIRSGLPIMVDLRYTGHQPEHRLVLARALQSLSLQGLLFALDANHLGSEQGLKELLEEVSQLIDLTESPMAAHPSI